MYFKKDCVIIREYQESADGEEPTSWVRTADFIETQEGAFKMSQEKVDRYKQEKANRKKIMKKQRIMNVLRTCAASLVGLALVGWLGYSAYDTYTANQEREVVSVNYDAINDYLNGLSE